MSGTNPSWFAPQRVVPAPRPDDTVVTPLAPDSAATAVLPVVADDTVVIGRIAPNPDETQKIGVFSGYVDGRPRRRAAAWAARIGRAPETLALSACGVVVVALAYAGGRSGSSWAAAAYWAGQLLVFVPVVVRMLSGRLAGNAEAFMLVVGMAVNQYAQKWLYSPEQFRFPDELQHWAATRTLLQSGRLFMPDYGLPVAVHFPGLEEMGGAFASMTGLPITAVGLLVAGVAHLTFVGVLFILVRSTGGSPALAGTACLLYATGLHYLFFDSMYIYQTAALPFLMLAVWASRRWRPASRENLPYAVVCLVSVAVTAVSHHVTAVFTVVTLLMIGLCEAVFGRARRWAMLGLAGGAALIVAAWFLLVANEVFGYLGDPVRGMVAQAAALLRGGGSSSVGGGGSGSPLWELAVQGIGLLALFALFCRAVLVTWRSTMPLDPWRAGLLAGAFVFFMTTVVRFVGGQGPELAGRASTFTYLPVAMIAAGVLVRWAPRLRPPMRHAPPRRLSTRVMTRRPITLPPVVLGTVVAAVLLVGARTGGWPPYWERLPGPHLVSGFERSIDAPGVSAAYWVAGLGPGNRVAADFTGVTLLGSYGDQDPVNEGSQLYYDGTWGLDDELLLQSLTIDYLWVDERMSRQLPVNGAYFWVDPHGGQITTPIPRGNLTKFDNIPGIDLNYDNGDIRIYDVRRA